MKYDNLMDRILDLDNLRIAYRKVVSNDGSAGIDGINVKELKDHLKANMLSIIVSLRSGRYMPQAVLGKPIQKSTGGTRLLGIPTTTDRVIQQAIHQVLSPMWEEEFSEFSYGFRPKRNAGQALSQGLEYINAGYQDVIDLDLKSFFDEVNHDKLMGLISKKISDKTLLQLIRRILESEIVIEGKYQKRRKGAPQGGPLSPLLSNILLNEFDVELSRRGHKFVRYADDCSIFLRSKRSALRVLTSITHYLDCTLKLKVNAEKTSICRPVNFELLGHSFTSTYKKGEKGKYRLSISKKSWMRLKEKIKVITKKTSPIPFTERIQRLNWLMRGWVNYFKVATGYEKFKYLDSWIRCRLRYCIWKGWKKANRRYRAFRQLGLDHVKAKQFSNSRLGGWRIACSPIMGTTVTEEKLKLRGYESFRDYYHKVHSKLIVT
ncbi:MAG: group II intron reverse transcriptase/maturase [Saprospiraceae bacterium]|nr:group II intron reverse transcriptase/maturase [Saprospiraceae bacterium]